MINLWEYNINSLNSIYCSYYLKRYKELPKHNKVGHEILGKRELIEKIEELGSFI